MSSSAIDKGFIAGLMAEMTALSLDLPPDPPMKDPLPDGFVGVGTIDDPHLKSLRFMMARCADDSRLLTAERFTFKAKQTLDNLPYESEARSIAKRRQLL